jgi:hypothetical protein
MLDENLLFHDGAVLTATVNSNSIDLGKTGANGVVVQIASTTVSGSSPTLNTIVQESTNDSTWVNLTTFDQVTASERSSRTIQTQKQYVRLSHTIGGSSPSFTVTAGIASGHTLDEVS